MTTNTEERMRLGLDEADYAENMAKFLTAAQSMWDTAHSTGNVELVADHPAAKAIDLFERVGPFTADVFGAKSVLDVGPGYARLLRALSHASRHAIEISPVNRQCLETWGIHAVAPGAIGVLPYVDVAWSASCLNHCPRNVVQLLLAQIEAALCPRGVVYLENIYFPHGGKVSVWNPAGPFPMPWRELAAECEGLGLRVVQYVDVPIWDAPGTSFGRYLLRAVKP